MSLSQFTLKLPTQNAVATFQIKLTCNNSRKNIISGTTRGQDSNETDSKQKSAGAIILANSNKTESCDLIVSQNYQESGL